MKRTYQPSKIKRARKHGFRSKMKTKGGKKLLARRRARGRKSLTVSGWLIEMKSKIVALSNNEEFKSLLKKDKVSNRYTIIYYGCLNNKNKRKLNISFSVNRKIGNAVTRNKIKRRLRNIMNDAVKKIPIKLNYSFLVIAKPTMLNNEFKIIKETLFQEFEKIKWWKF